VQGRILATSKSRSDEPHRGKTRCVRFRVPDCAHKVLACSRAFDERTTKCGPAGSGGHIRYAAIRRPTREHCDFSFAGIVSAAHFRHQNIEPLKVAAVVKQPWQQCPSYIDSTRLLLWTELRGSHVRHLESRLACVVARLLTLVRSSSILECLSLFYILARKHLFAS